MKKLAWASQVEARDENRRSENSKNLKHANWMPLGRMRRLYTREGNIGAVSAHSMHDA